MNLEYDQRVKKTGNHNLCEHYYRGEAEYELGRAPNRTSRHGLPKMIMMIYS